MQTEVALDQISLFSAYLSYDVWKAMSIPHLRDAVILLVLISLFKNAHAVRDLSKNSLKKQCEQHSK